MSKTSKIIATVALIIIFIILSGLIQAGSGSGGRNPGILGLVLFMGLIAGIRAIWKKSKDGNTTLNKD